MLSHKTAEIKVFLMFLLVDCKIRILSQIRIPIRTNTSDPDDPGVPKLTDPEPWVQRL
jgi:hypothetical protein